MPDNYAYLQRWNSLRNEPVLGTTWITEDEARDLYEAGSQRFDIVPGNAHDGDQPDAIRPWPPWVITAWRGGRGGYTATFVNKSGSVWRVEYSVIDDQLFVSIVSDHTYPDEDQLYIESQALTSDTASFETHGTGLLRVHDKVDQTVEKFHIENIDVTVNWTDPPAFGDWAKLTDPDYGATGAQSS